MKSYKYLYIRVDFSFCETENALDKEICCLYLHSIS